MDCRKNQVLRIKNVNKEEEGVSSSLLESKCARYFFDETVKKWGSDAKKGKDFRNKEKKKTNAEGGNILKINLLKKEITMMIKVPHLLNKFN